MSGAPETMEPQPARYDLDVQRFLESGSDFKIMARLTSQTSSLDPSQHIHATSTTTDMAHQSHAITSGGSRPPSLCDLAIPPENGQPQARAPAPRRIVVLDSSFNPPTQAHMWMALSAAREVGFDGTRVLLVLSVKNADKAAKPASFGERWGMMGQLAMGLREEAYRRGWARDGDGFGVEMALTTLPYFHQKSAALALAEREVYSRPTGSDPDACTEQELLIGYDTLIRILNPRYYEPEPMTQALGPMFQRARLRVTLRADAEWGGLQEQQREVALMQRGKAPKGDIPEEWGRRIEAVEGAPEIKVPVSSTEARSAATQQNWDLLATLVPTQVAQWIRERRLYQDESQTLMAGGA